MPTDYDRLVSLFNDFGLYCDESAEGSIITIEATPVPEDPAPQVFFHFNFDAVTESFVDVTVSTE